MRPTDPPRGSTWTFLSNHAHVMVCLTQEPELTMRDIAARVGITQRGVQKIIVELSRDGYLISTRHGRRNTYTLNSHVPLRHPLERHATIGDLLKAITTGTAATSTRCRAGDDPADPADDPADHHQHPQRIR